VTEPKIDNTVAPQLAILPIRNQSPQVDNSNKIIIKR